MLLLTYDLVQNGDSRLNMEIKEALIELGWRDDARYLSKPTNTFSNDTAPSTTLWKEDGHHEDGTQAFEFVCTAYATRHVGEGLKVKGKAICVQFSENEKSLLKIE